MDELNRFIKEIIASGTLNCHVCKKLMIAPVWLTLQGNNYCNSCYEKYTDDNKLTFFVANTSLDAILQKLPYPCENYNNGCKEMSPYPLYKEHILHCTFSPWHCLVPKCSWAGTKPSWPSHLYNEHKQTFLKEDVESTGVFILSYEVENQDSIVVLQTINGNFIARIKWTKKKLQVIIVHQSHPQELEGNFVIQYRIHPKELRLHDCTLASDLGCLLKFETSNNVIELDFNTALPQSPVQIVYKLRQNLSLIPEPILNYYRCYDCKEHMKMVIWECSAGHRFCEQCLYGDGHKCVNNVDFAGEVRRNNIMLPLAEKYLFPCRYRKFGCTFYVPLTNNHEDNCSYNYYECPFKIANCTMRVSHRSILTHIEEHHRKTFLPHGEYAKYPLDEPHIFSVLVHDKVFRVISEKCMRVNVYGLSEWYYEWQIDRLGKRTDDTCIVTVSIMKNSFSEYVAVTHNCGHAISFLCEDIKPFFMSDKEVMCSISIRIHNT